MLRKSSDYAVKWAQKLFVAPPLAACFPLRMVAHAGIVKQKIPVVRIADSWDFYLVSAIMQWPILLTYIWCIVLNS